MELILQKNNFLDKKEGKNNDNNNQNNSNNNSTLNQLILDSSKVNIFLEEQIKEMPNDKDNNLDVIKGLNKNDMKERKSFDINFKNNMKNGFFNVVSGRKNKDFLSRGATLNKLAFKETSYKKKLKGKNS